MDTNGGSKLKALGYVGWICEVEMCGKGNKRGWLWDGEE